MRELNQAITWYLERRPRIYALEIEESHFLWVTEQLPYKIDDNTRTVTILSVELDRHVLPDSN
jgi:hypothetical protein